VNAGGAKKRKEKSGVLGYYVLGTKGIGSKIPLAVLDPNTPSEEENGMN